jgi:hypothetical protein
LRREMCLKQLFARKSSSRTQNRTRLLRHVQGAS